MVGTDAEGGAERRPAIVVMGVSASGKSSVGEALAAGLGIAFVDGDDLHPAANRAKMAAGHPLTDADRAPWLDRVGAVLGDRAVHPAGVVVACSALRRRYRDQIRAGARGAVTFVFLDVSVDEAKRRIAARRGHFMPPSLVDSQFATLERPVDEADVIVMTRLDDPEQIARDTIAAMSRGRG